jgi:tryptophan halogenase
MGFDLRDLMRAAAGSFRLGTLNVETGGLHVYGDTGAPFGAIPFHLALRAHAEDTSPAAYGNYSLAALAARAGRFSPPISDGPAGSGYSPGLHLAGSAYQRFLERAALHYGVIPAGNLGAGQINTETGQVGLDDGSMIDGDLVIDTVGAKTESQRKEFVGLPEKVTVRYGIKNSCEPLGMATLHTVAGSRAVDVPFENDVYRTLISANEAADHLAASVLRKSGYEPISDAILSFRPGRVDAAWVGKVVYLGNAACRLPPVEAVELRILQIGLEALLQLLPGSGPSGPESREYNRLVGEAYLALADFVTLAFLGRGASLEAVSPTLSIRLENFPSRGRIVLMDGESFTRESWAAALIASGWGMERADAHASALPRARVRAQLAGIAGTLAASSETLPDQRTFLRRAGLFGAQKTGAG